MIGRAERAAGIARKIVVRAAVMAAVILPNPVQPKKNAEGVAPPYLDAREIVALCRLSEVEWMKLTKVQTSHVHSLP